MKCGLKLLLISGVLLLAGAACMGSSAGCKLSKGKQKYLED